MDRVTTNNPDWNISRMECKVFVSWHSLNLAFDWNISRMECKGEIGYKWGMKWNKIGYIQNGLEI